MRILKKYYEDVCKKKQEALKELYSSDYSISYRWQDLVKDAKK